MPPGSERRKRKGPDPRSWQWASTTTATTRPALAPTLAAGDRQFTHNFVSTRSPTAIGRRQSHHLARPSTAAPGIHSHYHYTWAPRIDATTSQVPPLQMQSNECKGLPRPEGAPRCQDWVATSICLRKRGSPMSIVSTVGIDLAKNVFSVHAVDSQGLVVVRRSLSRSKLSEHCPATALFNRYGGLFRCP